MANLDLKYKINIPFAENGDKDDIPDTSPTGLVNNTDGLGYKYDTPIAEGGEYFERQIFNGVVHKVYAAVKELQDLAVVAGFPVDMTKALNVLKIENGGTGANNATDARANLELGNLAVLDTVNTESIDDGAVTLNKLASNVVVNLPIGFIYFQLRGQATPDQLFGSSGKWQDISSEYAGEFFRAVGGNSANFGQKQNQGLPNITGELPSDSIIGLDLPITVSYVESKGFNKNIKYAKGCLGFDNSNFNVNTGYGSSSNIKIDASKSNTIYGASTDVTPYNSAVRIWKKIS